MRTILRSSSSSSSSEPPDPFAINEDVLIELIKTTEQPEILNNVRLVLNEKEAHDCDGDGSNNESDDNECDSE